MSLIPRDPFEAFMPLREAINRLFEESFITPRFEVLGTDDCFHGSRGRESSTRDELSVFSM